MIKKITASAILALGIAGAYFAVQNTRINTNSGADSGGMENNNLVSNQPFVESFYPKDKDSRIKSDSSDDWRGDSAAAQKENLTDYFVKGVGDALSQYNPDGAVNLNGQPKINVPDADRLSENLLAETISQFNSDSFKPAISDKDLKISSNNSPEALTSYFKNFSRIINESAKFLSPETLSAAEINLNQIEEFILVYGTAYKNLQAAGVPSTLTAIHKKELEFLGAKLAIYQALKNYESDPLLSILAAQSLEKIDQEYGGLDKEIAEFIKNNRLQL